MLVFLAAVAIFIGTVIVVTATLVRGALAPLGKDDWKVLNTRLRRHGTSWRKPLN